MSNSRGNDRIFWKPYRGLVGTSIRIGRKFKSLRLFLLSTDAEMFESIQNELTFLIPITSFRVFSRKSYLLFSVDIGS